MKLRPHHLLCTQGYSGKGYSPAFVENMNAITAILRTNPETPVDIVFSTDDICAHCPHMLGEDHCDRNEKVKQFDQKVIDYFGVEQKQYRYGELVAKVNREMTAERMDDICARCSWYPVSACKQKVLGGVR
ncbi:MAG: DUF1284 domain-containing protein [Oscillospiraceae bacterium]|nr:DUF1284 domain-containing protein [Oscillospiraceae bacterium]